MDFTVSPLFQGVPRFREERLHPYLAADQSLGNRRVALKVMRLDDIDDPEQFLLRFRREAALLANLEHPHICPVHEMGEINNVPFIAMKFVDGINLQDQLDANAKTGKTHSLNDAYQLIVKLADAVSHMHQAGAVHRDLKPLNIMIGKNGPMLIDFGLAYDVNQRKSQRMTHTGHGMGSYFYMPLEQLDGNWNLVDARVDVHALGVIYYKLLTGHFPHESADGRPSLALQASAPPTPLSKHRPGLPPALEAIILKAIAREPADRHASMAEFLAELKQWAKTQSRTGVPPVTKLLSPNSPQEGQVSDLSGTGQRPVLLEKNDRRDAGPTGERTNHRTMLVIAGIIPQSDRHPTSRK